MLLNTSYKQGKTKIRDLEHQLLKYDGLESALYVLHIYKLFIETRIEIQYLRHTRVSSSKDPSVALVSKKFKRPNKLVF